LRVYGFINTEMSRWASIGSVIGLTFLITVETCGAVLTLISVNSSQKRVVGSTRAFEHFLVVNTIVSTRWAVMTDRAIIGCAISKLANISRLAICAI
jgi:hypothetical protein